MDDSDARFNPSWPAVDMRQLERRSAVDRRVANLPIPPGSERRRGERRSSVDRRDESAWEALRVDAGTDDAPDAAPGLVAAATTARQFAHARYSHFSVGAALETADGTIITGCNIENATYGLTLCAERVALVKALSEGHALFTRLAVVADTGNLTPPCGPCRQLLWEYCGDIEVLLSNLAGNDSRHRLAELLPLPFDGRLLK